MNLQNPKPFQFDRPELELMPMLKSLCHDLRRHGFCIFRDEMVREMTHQATYHDIKAKRVDPRGHRYEMARQIALFQEACRWISIEKGQNLIMQDVPDDNGVTHMFVVLAPHGHIGTMPDPTDTYIEDDDGKGIHTREKVAAPDPTGPTMEIRTNSLRT